MEYLALDKTKLINLEYSLQREIIRTNRAGSYCCSTLIGCNTRKYHGLLVSPLEEFDGSRHVLLSTLHETIIQHEQSFNLGMHKFAGDHYEPKGHKYLRDYISDPIPKLQYRVGGVILSKEIVFIKNEHRILIKYTLEEANSPTKIQFKPFLAFRNIHSLSKANMDINRHFDEIPNGNSFRLYNGYPRLNIQFSKKADFVTAPDWYYDIEYLEEQKRGYDYKEDLYMPGYYELPIKKGESIIFSAGLDEIAPRSLKSKFTKEIKDRTPRDNYSNCLSNAASQFFVTNTKGTFIYAGYPWLPIRNRDMLMSLPGFTLPNNDPGMFKKVIKNIISSMNGHLLSETPFKTIVDYQASDISLWLIHSLQRYKTSFPDSDIWGEYKNTIKKIFNGYLSEESLFKVRENGLIYNYDKNHPQSWMNGILNSQPVVKRYGYLVETNALWYNAIKFINEITTEKTLKNKTEELASTIESNFEQTFWSDNVGHLADFVTDTHQELSMRPNQIFAYSFQYSALSKAKAMLMLQNVQQQLVTSKGIRTLSPADPNYKPYYEGSHFERENAAYNGSVWPWLYTYYTKAIYKLQPKATLRNAKSYIKKFEHELQLKGVCSVSEVFNGDPEKQGDGAISYALNTAELQYLAWFIEKEELKQL